MSYFYQVSYDKIDKTEIVTKEIPNVPGVKNMLLGQQAAGKALFVKSEIAAGSNVPYHKADNSVLLYFTAGNGTAFIQEDGEPTTFEIEAGDIILFNAPMKLHAYQSGNEGLDYFAVSLLP